MWRALHLNCRSSAGFTLVELMVVMMIAGVLMAIAVPSLALQRRHDAEASVRNDLRAVAAETELYFTDTGSYPSSLSATASTVTIASGYSVRVSADTVITYTSPARSGGYLTFCLVGSRRPGGDVSTQDWVWVNDRGGLQPAGTTQCV